jgi:L-fuculose-phosphate aldolase
VKSGRGVSVEIAQLARSLHDRGWVANHDGNITAKDGARIWATPTATSKRMVTEASMLQVDGKGHVVAGQGKVFGEIGLHLTVYQRRPDVAAVVHAHPPMATALACSRGAHRGDGVRDHLIARPFLPEAVVSLGPLIPKVALAMPGDPARAELAPWCEWVDAVLLGHHGVLAWGATLEQALLRLELVEHLATIAIAAQSVGGIEPLPDDMIKSLLSARAKAGLGRAADRALETMEQLLGAVAAAATPVVACAPAPHSATPIIDPPRAIDARAVSAVVREEIARALREFPSQS